MSLIPEDFNRRSLPILQIDRSANLYRPHPRDFDPIHFGKEAADRWSAPNGEYGVCFLAKTAAGAFAETFLRQPQQTLISEQALLARSLSELKARRALRLVPMFGPGLSAVGTTAATTAGGIQPSRIWSLALHSHPDAPDGIAYRLRHDNDEIGFALFERCKDQIVATGQWPWSDVMDEFGLYERYRLAIG